MTAIFVLPLRRTGVLVAAGYSSSNGTALVTGYDANGGVIWSYTPAVSIAGLSKSDSGEIYLYGNEELAPTVDTPFVEKVDPATGSVLWHHSITAHGEDLVIRGGFSVRTTEVAAVGCDQQSGRASQDFCSTLEQFDRCADRF